MSFPSFRSSSILEHFAALRDPREGWRVLYPLREILLVVLCATLYGRDDSVEIKFWVEARLELLRRFLPFKRGIPSRDTLDDVMNGIDPKLFKSYFTDWIETLRDGQPDIIAVDGKTSRRCHARDQGRAPLHLVSAWASRRRPLLGQEAADVEANEITAIPVLLERLHLEGALVTIDAMGTQKAIADAIVRRGGDRLLGFKADRPTTQDDVARFFADPPPDTVEAVHETVDADHGRVERRHHSLSWLWSDRRHADEPQFTSLAMISMAETRVERNGQTERDRGYHLSSIELDAEISPKPFEHIGTSKIGCTGPSMSCSTTTPSGSGPATDRRTWPSFAMSP